MMFSVEEKLKQMEILAEKYFEKYRNYMEDLEKHTVLGKVGVVSTWDYVQLGRQLEKFDHLVNIVKEEGGLSSLGAIPKVAYDVITAVYGNSVIPAIASVQNIEEEKGNVYFKVLKANGNTIVDPRTGATLPSGLSRGSVEDFVLATADGTATTFAGTLPALPVRPYTVKISAGDAFGQDDGNGNILGVGVWGAVDYATGAISLTFATAPSSGVEIKVSYQVDVESMNDLPTIDTVFESVTIDAKVYALKGVIGILKSYALRNRFGIVAEDEMAKDLTVAINNEIGGDLIRKYLANVPATAVVSWSQTPPSGVSYFEHKMTIKDAIANAEAKMAQNAGRGAITTLIAGTEASAILSTLPGFEKIADGKSMGAHVFGKLDGMVVIRVNDANAMPANSIIGVYNPASPFEGAGVYAPYMPLTTTELLPLGPNPLTNQKAVAVWAGVDVIVPQFLVRVDITA